jgi:hypothetical protein
MLQIRTVVYGYALQLRKFAPLGHGPDGALADAPSAVQKYRV